MTLIAAGDNLRNKSLMGLQAMSREEAEREALYQQMVQQKEAQRSQLAGTGLGIGASYAVNNAPQVKSAATALGQKLGLIKAAPAGGFFSQAGGGAALSQGANAANAGLTVGAGNSAPVVGMFAPTGGLVGGSTATLGAIAAPLAIGVGAFYLLNKLFD